MRAASLRKTLSYIPPKTAITLTRNAKIPTYIMVTIPGNPTNSNFFLAFKCHKYIKNESLFTLFFIIIGAPNF